MRTYRIEMRLAAAELEQKRKTPVTIVNSFPTREDSTAFYLSGGMEREEPADGPLTINLHFGDKPPTGDAFKIKWLRQYNPVQIDEIRHEWESSDCERGRVALAELDRLMEMEGAHTH